MLVYQSVADFRLSLKIQRFHILTYKQNLDLRKALMRTEKVPKIFSQMMVQNGDDLPR